MESSRIPDEALHAIRSRVSIVDVVSAHVALKRTGKNWKGLCPFHGEKTPSFVVSEERGTFHCFGCGAGGNVFRFLMEAEGRSFREAVEILAQRAGVRLEAGPDRLEDKKARAERDLLLEVLELSARYYRFQLMEGTAGRSARAYLETREIGSDASEAFRLGYAPGGWDTLSRYVHKKGIDPTLAARAGLLVERPSGGYYDRLRDRLVFPITDASGRVVSFGGRLLGPGEPKYLNGPETPVFRKHATLYGLFQGIEALRRERRAILVEGYIDVVSLHARGYRAALATLGTALTPDHVQALRRRVDEVALVYDGDQAGRKAAFRSLDLFLAGALPCRAVLLPPEHDPDSFVRAGGDLAAQVKDARFLFDLYLEELGTRFDLRTVEGRLGAVDALLPSLAAVPDALARDLYVRSAADRLDVGETELRAKLREGRGGRSEPPPVLASTSDSVERGLLECLVHDPQCRALFLARDIQVWMKPGAVKEASLFVASRSETADALPIDEAPGGVRTILSMILVEEVRPRATYETLETTLRSRHLKAWAEDLLRRIREAEAIGDNDGVLKLQREKMEVDKAVQECCRG